MVKHQRLIIVAMSLLATPWVAAATEPARLPYLGFSWQFTVRDHLDRSAAAVVLSEEEQVTPRRLPFSLPLIRHRAAGGQHPAVLRADPGDDPVRLGTSLPLFSDGWLSGGIAIAQEVRRLDLGEMAVTAKLALRL